jgi:hypothetical protein
MWEPRRLTTPWATTACYRGSFTFYSKRGTFSDDMNLLVYRTFYWIWNMIYLRNIIKSENARRLLNVNTAWCLSWKWIFTLVFWCSEVDPWYALSIKTTFTWLERGLRMTNIEECIKCFVFGEISMTILSVHKPSNNRILWFSFL